MPNIPTEKRNYEVQYKWWNFPEKLAKLEECFAIGCTDREACSLAEITLDQLYYYTKEVNKDFQVRKDELKEKPFLKARKTIFEGLNLPENAKWFLERKLKSEFALRNELTGKDGESLKIDMDVNIENLSNEELMEILKSK